MRHALLGLLIRCILLHLIVWITQLVMWSIGMHFFRLVFCIQMNHQWTTISSDACSHFEWCLMHEAVAPTMTSWFPIFRTRVHRSGKIIFGCQNFLFHENGMRPMFGCRCKQQLNVIAWELWSAVGEPSCCYFGTFVRGNRAPLSDRCHGM